MVSLKVHVVGIAVVYLVVVVCGSGCGGGRGGDKGGGSLVHGCIYQCASTTKYFLQLDEETLR